MGLLFETTPENVLIHLKNIFAENELPEAATAKEFLTVQSEGKREVQRSILHYNIDAIIAVGYRVNSKRATAFRQWATGVLRDYTLRGSSKAISTPSRRWRNMKEKSELNKNIEEILPRLPF